MCLQFLMSYSVYIAINVYKLQFLHLLLIIPRWYNTTILWQISKVSTAFQQTDSIRHSVPANIAPSTAKFLAYDTVRTFISFATRLTVGVSVPVILGSIPAVKRPNTAPIAPPIQKANNNMVMTPNYNYTQMPTSWGNCPHRQKSLGQHPHGLFVHTPLVAPTAHLMFNVRAHLHSCELSAANSSRECSRK